MKKEATTNKTEKAAHTTELLCECRVELIHRAAEPTTATIIKCPLCLSAHDMADSLRKIAKKNSRGYTYDRDEAYNIAANTLAAVLRATEGK